MLGDVDSLETRQTAHADVVEMRKEKCVDKVPAIDREFWIIDCLFCDLETRGARAQKTTAPSPIEFDLRFSRAGNEERQIEAKEVVAFDDVRIAFLDQRGQTLERRLLGFLHLRRIDHDQFF